VFPLETLSVQVLPEQGLTLDESEPAQIVANMDQVDGVENTL
jgi:hypothetical protein